MYFSFIRNTIFFSIEANLEHQLIYPSYKEPIVGTVLLPKKASQHANPKPPNKPCLFIRIFKTLKRP